jgi:hypothetical protein
MGQGGVYDRSVSLGSMLDVKAGRLLAHALSALRAVKMYETSSRPTFLSIYLHF